MKRIFLPLLIFILHAGPALLAQQVATRESRRAMIQEFLAEQKDFNGILLMGEAGKVTINHGSGFADRANQIPYSDQTLGTIGSITKPFTATAIMILYEQGKLHPSDLLSLYLAGVPGDKKDITLHHLLTHTAGLPGAIGDDYAATTDASFLDLVWKTPLEFAPGTGYAYSNVGYSLLGLVIEKVSGLSYSAFLQQNILQPAGLMTAGYKNPAIDVKHLAHGYRHDGSDWGTSHDKPWNDDEPYWHLKANGGLIMSARDMYQWYLALRANTILQPATLALQTFPHADEGMQDSYYGYGYVVDKEGHCIQHNGGNGIFKADFRWFPKADLFIYGTTNDANVRLFRLVDEVVHIWETGEMPARFDWVPVDAGHFPSNENERAAEALSRLLSDFSMPEAKAFVSTHCSPGLIERNGHDRLLEVLQMLHNDTGGQNHKEVLSSGDNMMLVYPEGAMGATLKIILSFREHRIDRLGAEIGG